MLRIRCLNRQKHFAAFLSFLCLWQLVSVYTQLTPVMDFMYTLKSLLLQGDTIYHVSLFHMLFVSLRILLTACILAGFTAIPVGLFLGYHREAGAFFARYIELIRPIPPLAWIPLGYALFEGFYEPTYYVQLLVVFTGAFFPLLTAAVYGVRSVNPLLLDAARTLGAKTGSKILYKVVLPSALPSIIGGIKSSLGVGWMCIVGAEFVGGKMGIGSYIWNLYSIGGRMTELMIAVFLVGLTGCCMNKLVSFIERRVLVWYYL